MTWKAAVESGAWPTEPAATCTFCSRTAVMTSPAVKPRAAIRSGSSHRRMLYSPAPHTSTSLIPGRRDNSSRTCR
ncbi:hypothetical protein PFLmoz3_00630 [Pseudomonas fluorescens]|uniref:Uncharacterized protein n=1 Tax=Pseudomonas fluorescens TaxID=294 RepID=A0A109LLD9_PSEFL|nr:hypothetical protein PFLmoz3_00630 [Pseudomonas fluorescens]